MLERRLSDLVGEVLLLFDVVDEDGEVEHDPKSEGMSDGQVALGQGLSFLVGRLGFVDDVLQIVIEDELSKISVVVGFHFEIEDFVFHLQ